MKYRAIEYRKSAKLGPIIVRKNDRVQCGEVCTDPGWEDWIMCSKDGKRGWVPLWCLEELPSR